MADSESAAQSSSAEARGVTVTTEECVVTPRLQRGCSDVPPPPTRPLEHNEVFDSFGRPQHERIRAHFLSGGYLTDEDASEIIVRAHAVLRQEPNVLLLDDPITVCGDVHGQFYDLQTLFQLGGDPLSTQYLFLGDYVDRGSFSTEVALYIFSLKLLCPQSIWLLRGNHECRHLTAYFNFKEECLHKYSTDVYDHFMTAFDALPLAALIGEGFLCVHGGLSPDIKSIDDISLIDRFREPPTSGAMCDLLWADPMEDEEERLCPDALYLHNELRGCSYIFSHAAVEHFLKENDLLCLIRAHEAQDEGFRMYRKIQTTGFPGVICVFSAPNYCDSYDNKAAILQINKKVIHLKQYHCVEHPYMLPNFINAFGWSLPFVSDKLYDILSMVSNNTNGLTDPASVLNTVVPHLSIKASYLKRRGNVFYIKLMAVVAFIVSMKTKRRARRASLHRVPQILHKKALQKAAEAKKVQQNGHQ